MLYLFIQIGTIIPCFAGEQILGICFVNFRFLVGGVWLALPANDTRFKVNVCNMLNSNLIKKNLDRPFILYYFSYNLNT